MERIIGGFMEWLRVKHKQSIKATSKIIGVDEHTLRRWENGLTSPDILKFKEYMNNYGNDYGVENKYNGVEFFFEIDLAI